MVANITDSGQTYTITIDPLVTTPGLKVTISTDRLTLGAGATGSFTVALSAATSVPTGDYQGDIRVQAGRVVQRIPYWVRIDRQGLP